MKTKIFITVYIVGIAIAFGDACNYYNKQRPRFRDTIIDSVFSSAFWPLYLSKRIQEDK